MKDITTHPTNAGAIFSEDGRMRYMLWRIWRNRMPKVLFIMLNPSMANEFKNDSTIVRLISFSKQWGYGGFYVGNLFAIRGTKPSQVFKNFHKPILNEHDRSTLIGEKNDLALREMAAFCDKIVFAWGNDGIIGGRDKEVIEMFSISYCLGVTTTGQPKHPLYLKSITKPEIYKI